MDGVVVVPGESEVVGALWHEENQVQLIVVVATGITGDLGPIRQGDDGGCGIIEEGVVIFQRIRRVFGLER